MASIFGDSHLKNVRLVTPQTTKGCQDCIAAGTRWVHLRLCLTCGPSGAAIRRRCAVPVPMRRRRAARSSTP